MKTMVQTLPRYPSTPVQMPVPAAGGVQPIGVLEPFNQVQRDALASVASGPTNKYGFQQGAVQSYQNALTQAPNATPMFQSGDQFYNTANQFLTGAQGNIAAGTGRLTDDRFNEYMTRYLNPYQTQVVDSTTNAIQRAADIQRSRLNANATAAGAFGGDRDAIERDLLNQSTLRQVGDTTGGLLYQGYNDAVKNALSQYDTETRNALTGASVGIQGGATAGGIGADRYRQGFTALDNLKSLTELGLGGREAMAKRFYEGADAKLAAGGIIQNQNQNMLNAIRGVQTAPTEYLQGVLNPLLGGSTGPTQAQPNFFDKLGGALGSIYSFGQQNNGFSLGANSPFNFGGGA